MTGSLSTTNSPPRGRVAPSESADRRHGDRQGLIPPTRRSSHWRTAKRWHKKTALCAVVRHDKPGRQACAAHGGRRAQGSVS